MSDALDRYQRHFEKKLAKFEKDLSQSRLLTRSIIYKIIIISSSIIGFSLTLASLTELGFRVNISLLKTSWYLFLATIILGYLIVFFEGRLHYALKWKAFQVQDDDKDYKYPRKEKLKVWLVCLYTLVFPRNLVFCGIYPSKEESKQNAILNGKVVLTLAELEKVTFLFENVFIILFIAGLYSFIRSYN